MELLDEFIKELSPDVRNSLSQRLRQADKDMFIESAKNAWKVMQSDPKIYKAVKSIYYESFSKSLSNMRLKDNKGDMGERTPQGE